MDALLQFAVVAYLICIITAIKVREWTLRNPFNVNIAFRMYILIGFTAVFAFMLILTAITGTIVEDIFRYAWMYRPL